MAVGPSLRQLHAHRAIHDGGVAGAVQRTEQLILSMSTNMSQDEVKVICEDLLDYWETRIISHADSEEEENGFYQEAVDARPELADTVMKLTRDHDLLRIMLDDTRQIFEKEGVGSELIYRFRAMILVSEIHSRDEEQYLLTSL